MTLLTVLTALLGLGCLTGGAEWMVRGASSLAVRLGISPLVVGLTVVALGTSAPEAAVSLAASMHGQGGMAFGNVVGSNIFNVLAIVGLTGIIAPLCVAEQIVRFDVPIMIVVSLLVAYLAADGRIGAFEGLILLLLLIGYVAALIRTARRSSDALVVVQEVASPVAPRTAAPGAAAWAVPLLQAIIGLELLIVGSHWFVRAAAQMARSFGISELVIGLTIVAVGTSLPEVFVSLVAAVRGQRDIAIGNVVGSNILNLLLVLGMAGVAAPDGLVVPAVALHRDLPVMIGAAIACLPIFLTGRRVSRAEGLLMLGTYVAFIAYVVLDETRHPWRSALGHTLVLGALPAVLVLFVLSLARSRRAEPRS